MKAKQNSKSTLICTLKNEKKHLRGFLESIEKQSLKPDEIIFVDGGSTDGTVEILKNLARKNKRVKVFVKPGMNIAQGRNFAVEKARNDVIAATDAGCILDKNWFKNITSHFPRYDVVAGVYEPYYENAFEQAQGVIVCKDIDKLDDSFLPSSRSIAFKKSAWKAVGGYPESLYTGEDTLFDLRLKKAGFNFKLDKKALVRWRMRSSWKKFAKQFYLYGVGDRRAGNILRMRANLAMILGTYLYVGLLLYLGITRPLLGIGLFCILPVYGLYHGVRVALAIRNDKGLFYGTFLSLIKRVAYVVGVTLG